MVPSGPPGTITSINETSVPRGSTFTITAMPLLVEGRPDNIKITRTQDLLLAELVLAAQARET